MRRIGFLLGLAEKDPEANTRIKAFRLGMRDLGWIEGRNVHIEYRFAGSNLELIKKTCRGVGQRLRPTSLSQTTRQSWLR